MPASCVIPDAGTPCAFKSFVTPGPSAPAPPTRMAFVGLRWSMSAATELGKPAAVASNSGATLTRASGPATSPSIRWADSPLAMTTVEPLGAAMCATATLVAYRSAPAMRVTGLRTQPPGRPRRLRNVAPGIVLGAPFEDTPTALRTDPPLLRSEMSYATTSGRLNAYAMSAWVLVRDQDAMGLCTRGSRLQWSSTLRR